MARGQLSPSQPLEPALDRAFVERERNRFANRALSFLVVLNGAAALILLTILAQAPEGTVDRKIATALLFFSSGAVAALLSSFLAYVNRTVRMQQSARRENLRAALRGLAIAVVIGSGAAFLTGMNMVATTAAEKSSSHPKGPRQDTPPATSPSEKVERLDGERLRAGSSLGGKLGVARV
jgi:hypothetical protein